jgi:flavodoxin I
MKRALIIYWSKTGNTEKVANSIKKGLEQSNFEVTVKKTEEAEMVDYFDYDLVCVGCPSDSWHPPEPITHLLHKKFEQYKQEGKIKPRAPKVPKKNALIFVTYSGPHTGIHEAIPVGKDIRQYFEHLGFTIVDECYVLSEFHGSLEYSTQGRMGDIRGWPTAEQLKVIENDIIRIANLIRRSVSAIQR